jgi:ABC-type polysaccharide/polyol phosphate export permease
MNSLFADLSASMRHPEFWALSSWLDIVVRNRQSRLGILWLMMPAVVYIWGMGGFFSIIMRVPLAEFAAHVAIGYLLFRVVSGVIVESTGAFASAGPFILDGHTRLSDFVMRVLATALFYFLVSLPVAIPALVVHPNLQWTGVLFSVVSLPIILLNTLWIGVVFGLVGARFPDLKHLISNILTFAFLLTPIVWQANAMPAGSLRGNLMRANPLYHMVEFVRAPILGEAIDPSTLSYIAIMTVVGWLVAILAYRRYARYVPLWI